MRLFWQILPTLRKVVEHNPLLWWVYSTIIWFLCLLLCPLYTHYGMGLTLHELYYRGLSNNRLHCGTDKLDIHAQNGSKFIFKFPDIGRKYSYKCSIMFYWINIHDKLNSINAFGTNPCILICDFHKAISHVVLHIIELQAVRGTAISKSVA